MRKLLVVALAAMVLMGTVGSSTAINTQRGGLMGFIAGCCFGIRTGAAYNDGKEVHWRQWCRLIPYVNIVFAIWDGVDGTNGMQTKDYASKYGSVFY
jgi:hypothetical protein